MLCCSTLNNPVTLAHMSFFLYFYHHGCQSRKGNDRDIRDNSKAIRFNLGFKQGQLSSVRYMGQNDIKIPTVVILPFIEMESRLRECTGDLFEVCFRYLQLKDDTLANNPLRELITHSHLTSPCFPGKRVGFEYYNVSMRDMSSDILGKHMDHLNDWRVGYNHCMVYSYFVPYREKLYCITIVMTFRRSIGSIVEKIAKLKH